MRVLQGTRENAFTLIELVISAAVASMILIGAYMCLSAGLASQKVIEPRSETIQNARVALAMISSDLRTACPMAKEFDFLGMDRTIDDVEADNLDFATHNYTPKRPGEGDFCQMSYFLEKAEDGKFNLWRRRNPVIAIDPLMGGNREEIIHDVIGLRFEYFDGLDWYDDWGDATNKKEKDPILEPNLSGMPQAVRITLELPSEPKRGSQEESDETQATPSLTFQTVVRLELAGDSTSTGVTSESSTEGSQE